MQSSVERTVLGRTGVEVGRLGISASYGMPAAVEYAFERGVNCIYWGSLPRKAFAEGVRNLKRERERMVLRRILGGEAVQAAAAACGVCKLTTHRWLRRYRTEGAV